MLNKIAIKRIWTISFVPFIGQFITVKREDLHLLPFLISCFSPSKTDYWSQLCCNRYSNWYSYFTILKSWCWGMEMISVSLLFRLFYHTHDCCLWIRGKTPFFLFDTISILKIKNNGKHQFRSSQLHCQCENLPEARTRAAHYCMYKSLGVDELYRK